MQYRVLYLTPDPFRGDRVAIGALLTRDGRVELVRAPHLPSADCVGGEGVARLAHAILEDLGEGRAGLRFDELPLEAGSLVGLGAVFSLPSRTEDPSSWLQASLFRTAHREVATRPLQRRRAGLNFLQNIGVGQLVHRAYRPSKDRGHRWNSSRTLDPVSFYAEGKGLLLMEPIVPSRRLFKKHVSHVSTLFGAYSSACEEDGVAAKLAAFVLPGGSDDAREYVVATLQQWRKVDVLDVADPIQRNAFVEEIRRTASPLIH